MRREFSDAKGDYNHENAKTEDLECDTVSYNAKGTLEGRTWTYSTSIRPRPEDPHPMFVDAEVQNGFP